MANPPQCDTTSNLKCRYCNMPALDFTKISMPHLGKDICFDCAHILALYEERRICNNDMVAKYHNLSFDEWRTIGYAAWKQMQLKRRKGT